MKTGDTPGKISKKEYTRAREERGGQRELFMVTHMVEPLRKRRKNGSLYRRRTEVEKELERLEKLSLAEVLAHARKGERAEGEPISSEALMHILRREVRTATTRSPTLGPIDGLLSMLIRRSELIVQRHVVGVDEVYREAICRQVTDRIVDAIFADSDHADYAEVNFNDWLMHNRIDAYRIQKRKTERIQRLGDAVEDLEENEAQVVPGGIDDKASRDPTPEGNYAYSEACEKVRLPREIDDADLSPDDRYRIATMLTRANLPAHIVDAFLLHHYLGMQIEAGDPEIYTLTKKFGKSEKTIRLWIKQAEKAFAKLRETKHEIEPNETNEPGIGVARVPR